MTVLNIDIETYCELNLRDVGVHRYVEHPSFEVLMAAFRTDDDLLGITDTEVIDFTVADEYTDGKILELTEMLTDPEVVKTAWNASFERNCLAKAVGAEMPPEEWDDTMVRALRLGLPMSLDQAAETLKLERGKMKEGKALIRYFSMPCKATKVNGGRTRNLPEHDPDRWALFLKYCGVDVDVESEITLWNLDQRINDGGVLLDRTMVNSAAKIYADHKVHLLEYAKELTGLDNPNSDAQLKAWISENSNIDAMAIGLNKTVIPKIRKLAVDYPKVIEVLDIRAELKKTSNSKYNKMQEIIGGDDRARGLIQFYGANRTGRWAGRQVQVQNLPQNKIPDLADARELVVAGDIEAVDMLYGNVPNILSQLIRTAFIPKEGCTFYVADFSAIEARVIAWISNELWRMDVFNTHGKIYEASAAEMYRVDIDTIAKGRENYELRAKGKIGELALGFGGGVGALKAFGGDKMGLTDPELKSMVNKWRKTSPAVVDFWWSVGDAAMDAVREPGRVKETHGLHFLTEKGILFIELFSGRKLAYFNPRVRPGKFNKDELVYEGLDQVTKRWTTISSYGPKLVENIVQAVARDLLAYSMMQLDKEGYKIVMHVHDEVIIEHPTTGRLFGQMVNRDTILDHICKVMGNGPEWADGLPLNADGYTCDFYMKD